MRTVGYYSSSNSVIANDVELSELYSYIRNFSEATQSNNTLYDSANYNVILELRGYPT